MTGGTPLDCRTLDRRGLLFGNPDYNGIDYVDVSADQKSLCIHFFNNIPKGVGVANIRISGGRRITGIRATRVYLDLSRDEDLDDCLRVEVDRPGDLSTYRLCLAGGDGGPMPGIDPRYACVDFSFRIDCPGDLDCVDDPRCEAAEPEQIEIDYLAKDYSSFRRLIYDRLALIMPEWRERHAADLGVTLVEILAYVGDYLSYYQDSVATEAYLDTARQRRSVRRHLRLIDYRLHEGCNARAFVAVESEADFTLPADGFFFITRSPADAARPPILTSAEYETLDPSSCDAFEPLAPAGTEIVFRAARSRILIHDWGESECCLPKGATRATLVDPGDERADLGKEDAEPESKYQYEGSEAETPNGLDLRIGDFLIFEEVVGPLTGNEADADPAHRHAVRLTSVVPGFDALLGTRIVEIGWAQQDALPFPLCLSVRRPAPDCDLIRQVSVVRGNVVLVDHGRTVHETLDPPERRIVPVECACEGSIIECRIEPAVFEPPLRQMPLTFAQPADLSLPAAAALDQDVRATLPAIRLHEETEHGEADWLPRGDLLSSGPDDRHFVAEIDDEGRAWLRFGDGEHGRRPEPGAALAATYRIGNGLSGNVGREAIALMVVRNSKVDAGDIRIRNPLPAAGGSAPEPVADAKLLGPGSIFARRERAVVAEDYAELALRSPKVQSAAAELRWTGSWYEAGVALDPVAGTGDPAELAAEVARSLHLARRIGHDLDMAAAKIVPLRLKLEICVAPHHSRGHVRAALLDAFGAGRTGFFHADRLRFGDDVYVSQIVAAAMAVEGVETATVKELRRLNRTDEGALESGRLAIGPYEIARLDNDPNFPENGQLELSVGGGR
jgi:hypothetical protein